MDVKPPGPGWATPPFEPTRVGHRLVARGASDDKGQLLPHLVALRAWAAAGGPPGDVVTLVDGTEEVGSPGLGPLLARLRRPGARGPSGPLAGLLAGPVGAVLVVDTRGAGPGRPTVTLSQRGSVALRVRVDVGGAPVHAGRLGGAVVDPSLVLAAALGRAEHAATRLVGPARAGRPGTTAFPTDAVVRAQAGARAVHPDRPAARATVRGALTVSRLDARAAAGAVPVRATARVDLRLPPGLPAARGRAVVERALRRDLPPGVHLETVGGPATTGHHLRPPPAALDAVARACLAAYGRTPARAASGGSVPAVGVLARVLGCDPVLLGLGPADDGAHGPDEHLDLRDWARAVDAHVVLLATVGSICRKAPAEPVPWRAGTATVASVVEPWGSHSATRSGVP
nr:M20/M25/M40 family metallo-hydrolase [Nocardioides luti]